jgi:hypothetical protein
LFSSNLIFWLSSDSPHSNLMDFRRLFQAGRVQLIYEHGRILSSLL